MTRIPAAEFDVLAILANQHGTSKTLTVRQAIKLFARVDGWLTRGMTVYAEDEYGVRERLVTT